MPDNIAVVSISELNRRARICLEGEFPLLWVSGEVSNLTRAASGHYYFSLKDDSAQARCVMFRSRAQLLAWRLENGQQVEAQVLVSLYEARGDFQLNVETLRRAGLGRLFEAFGHLKLRLEGEGLFAPARKRTLPGFPCRIGIISSPRAAALHDVLVTLGRRAPHLAVVLYPTAVQGEAAAGEIVAAIAAATRRRDCDLLLIVRGGGSIEDLWAFNEEAVARAIAATPLPTITGIGHESDITIADFVADVRAATPTAAAELATQGWLDAEARMRYLVGALQRSAEARIAALQQAIDLVSLRLVHPSARLTASRDRLAIIGARLNAAFSRRLAAGRHRAQLAQLAVTRCRPSMTAHRGQIELLAQRLVAGIAEQVRDRTERLRSAHAALVHLSPDATLARGFAIVSDLDGRLVTDSGTLRTGQAIFLRLARGEAEAAVLTTRPEQQTVANENIVDYSSQL